MNPTSEQLEIITQTSTSTTNLVVQGVAGCGKTSTIIQAINTLPSSKSILLVAFNRVIAEEFQKRVPTHVEAKTVHSLGSKYLRQIGWYKVNDDKIENFIKYDLLDWKNLKDSIRKELSPKVHALLDAISFSKAYNLTPESDYLSICSRFGLDTPDFSEVNKTFSELLRKALIYSREKRSIIDFDDMIYLPLQLGLLTPTYDFVFVDEAQDLNLSQRVMCQKVLKPNGKIISIGDPFQSIYGFRGADPNSMDSLQKETNATRLPLTNCWRCYPQIINEVNLKFPHIPIKSGLVGDAIVRQGSIDTILREAQVGDFILCRTNAPLVEVFFTLVKHGKQAKFRGYDVLKSILPHVENLEKENYTLTESCVYTYFAKRIEDLKRKKLFRPIGSLEETCEVIINFVRAGKTQRLSSFLKSAFTESNSNEVITLSSIHKAKGLEADRVWFYKPELLPHKYATLDWELQQEDNLWYVAVTRAKKELVYVY